MNWAGALELAGVGIDGTLESLLRRQLRKLLCDQVMGLGELLQQVMARRHRRIDQLRVWLLLRPTRRRWVEPLRSITP